MLSLDMIDRGDFLRWFYRRYEDASLDELSEESWELTSDLLVAKSFPAGIRRVREHRALGHRTLLITGALDFVIEPLPSALRRRHLRPHERRRCGCFPGSSMRRPRRARPGP